MASSFLASIRTSVPRPERSTSATKTADADWAMFQNNGGDATTTVDKSMAPTVRARLLISSTKVPTAFTTSGAGRELRARPTGSPDSGCVARYALALCVVSAD